MSIFVSFWSSEVRVIRKFFLSMSEILPDMYEGTVNVPINLAKIRCDCLL